MIFLGVCLLILASFLGARTLFVVPQNTSANHRLCVAINKISQASIDRWDTFIVLLTKDTPVTPELTQEITDFDAQTRSLYPLQDCSKSV